MSPFVKNNLGFFSGKSGFRDSLKPKKRDYFPTYSEKDSVGPKSQKPDKAEKSRIIRNRKPGFLDFSEINRAALSVFPVLLACWLPDGYRQGDEWVARNPTRNDRNPGSFKINMKTGKWADFATGEGGGGVISLAAYLSGTRQIEAAKSLADHLGVHHG